MADHELSRRNAIVGLVAVTGVMAASAAGLAESSGWLSPPRLTPTRFTDRFEQVYGRHNGFRRNHAKGIAATGTFTSSGAGVEVSKASVFEHGTMGVTARFSMSGGVPDAADKPATVRGLGILFELPDGHQWRTAMVNLPVFPDSTPEGFYERTLASKPDPATGQPDPLAMSAFLARHPETAAAMKVIKSSPPSPGFADSTFRGLNAFIATNHSGVSVPIRWAATPVDTCAKTVSGTGGDDCLFDALIARVRRGPVRWRLMVTVAEPDDPTHDATLAWPAQRRTIEAGVITIDQVHTESEGNARDVNFDPLVLPDGLDPSDDPLPRARSAVYARSFDRRSREPKSPSEVNVAEADRGY
jgi:catalase